MIFKRKMNSKLAPVLVLSAALAAGSVGVPAFAVETGIQLEVIETDALQTNYLSSAAEGRILFYNEDGYYGYMDYDGNIVIPATYDYAYNFASGLAKVSTEKGTAYIDMEGNIKFYEKDILNRYDLDTYYPEVYDFHEGYAKVSTYEGVTYINTDGEFILPMNTYYSGYDFSNGLAKVFDEDYNEFFINPKGEVVLQGNPDYAYNDFSNGLAVIYDQNNGQYGYVNTNGDLIVNPGLDWAEDFVGNIALYKEIGKYGVVDNTGKFLIPPTFEEALITEDGYVVGYDGVFTVFLDQNMKPVNRIVGNQLYSTYGNVYLRATGASLILEDLAGNDLGSYDDVYYLGDHIFELPGSIVNTKDIVTTADPNSNMKLKAEYTYSFINNKGETAIDLSQYDSANQFSEGLAVVEKNGKFGYIDTQGQVVIPVKYVYASDFYDGYASVETATDYLTIDKTGKVIDNPNYIDFEDDSDFYVISTGYYGDAGVASKKTNKIVLEAKYNSITAAGMGLFELMDEDYNYGFYNANTGKLVEPQFEYITILPQDERVVVQNEDGNYGMYDTNGKMIMEANYDSITQLDNDLYEVQKDYYYSGVIDKDGKILIKPEFDTIYTDQATEGIVVFSTEKSGEGHILVYDMEKKKVLNDDTKGVAVGFGDTVMIVRDDVTKYIMTYDGKVLAKTDDYYVETYGDYSHFEDENGTDYLIDNKGKTYLAGNDFKDIYLPVEDGNIIYSTDEGFGIVTIDGKVKTKKMYDNVYYIDSGIMATYDDEIFGYVNTDGEDIVVPGYYDLLFNFTDGLGLTIKAK